MLVYLTPDEGDYLREKDSLDCTFSYLKSISTVQLGIAKDDVMTRHPGQFDGLKPAGSFPCGSSIYISLTNSFDARFLAFFCHRANEGAILFPLVDIGSPLERFFATWLRYDSSTKGLMLA